MLKTLFSFKGRTRRFEYGLSLLLSFMAAPFISIIGQSSDIASVAYVFFIPLLWFQLAQSIQRCHDIGKSGYYILIPLFGLWMLFADSEPGTNEYGPNPKGK